MATETVKMTLNQYQAEHERLLTWRDRWSRLSNKFEPGRLASRQERVEERARKANQQIGRLINEFDKQQRESNALDRDTLLSNWPLTDVLTQLADWAAHLGNVHDCDCHGWEAQSFLISAARIYAAQGAARGLETTKNE